MHRHDEHEIDLVQNIIDEGDRRLRIDGDAGGRPPLRISVMIASRSAVSSTVSAWNVMCFAPMARNSAMRAAGFVTMR